MRTKIVMGVIVILGALSMQSYGQVPDSSEFDKSIARMAKATQQGQSQRPDTNRKKPTSTRRIRVVKESTVPQIRVETLTVYHVDTLSRDKEVLRVDTVTVTSYRTDTLLVTKVDTVREEVRVSEPNWLERYWKPLLGTAVVGGLATGAVILLTPHHRCGPAIAVATADGYAHATSCGSEATVGTRDRRVEVGWHLAVP